MKAGFEFEELSEHDKLHLRQYLSYVMEQRKNLPLALGNLLSEAEYERLRAIYLFLL